MCISRRVTCGIVVIVCSTASSDPRTNVIQGDLFYEGCAVLAKVPPLEDQDEARDEAGGAGQSHIELGRQGAQEERRVHGWDGDRFNVWLGFRPFRESLNCTLHTNTTIFPIVPLDSLVTTLHLHAVLSPNRASQDLQKGILYICGLKV